MSEYTDQEFEMKLMLLKNKQTEIQSLSKWCLKRQGYLKNIVSIWLKVIKKVKIEKRLTLFYLANDIILRSKKVNGKFVNAWVTSIPKIIPYVRDDKIQSKILRIIKIWKERAVYDFSYINILTVLLNVPIKKIILADPAQKFQVEKLAVKIGSCEKLEQIKELKMKTLKETNLSLTNNEAIQNMLQARTTSYEFLNELDDGITKIESYIDCLQRETVDRAQLIDALEVAVSYYNKQNKEIKKVAKNYFNFAKQLKLQKRKLEPLLGSMPTNNSMSSLDINVSSPSTSSESVEDLSIHNINTDDISDTDVYVSTSVVTDIKSTMTSDSFKTVQELYDPASVSFLRVENQDQQILTSQFSFDALLQTPDETFANSKFFNQTNVSCSNEIDSQSKSTYTKNNHEANVPTPIPSSQQNITNTTSSLVSGNSIPMTIIQPTAKNETLDNWSINDTPASPPFHETISDQKVPIININADERLCLHHNVSVSKLRSSRVFSDINYRVVPDIPAPTLPSGMCMEDIIKPPKNNIIAIDDSPTSPPYYEKLSHQYFPIVTSLTDRGIHVNYNPPLKKKEDKDEIMTYQKKMPKSFDSEHTYLMNLTQALHMNSSTILSDINYPTVSDIPKPPSPPVMHMEAVTKPPEKNITITNDSPASPPYHEKISHQQILTNLTNIEHFIDCSALVTKNQDKDERIISQKKMPKSFDSDHTNLMSLTHSLHMNPSSTILSDVNYPTVSDIPKPPSPPVMHMEAVTKPPEKNITVTNDSPASLPYHEKISHQQILTNLTNIEHFKDCCALVTKNQDKDERMISQKKMPKSFDSDHTNLMSLTHSLHMNPSSTILSDVNYPTVSDITKPPSPPVMHVEAVTKPPEKNITITYDSPASPPYHEEISHQQILTNLVNIERFIDCCALVTKNQDKDERMISQKKMPKSFDSDHTNLMSLTHSLHMNSSTILSDINYPTVSDIPKPPSPPVMHMEAVTKPPEKNITITNDNPASPPYHEKISHQQTLTNLVNIERFIDCCALVTKNQDKDERIISQKKMPKSFDSDHTNLMSLTHSLHMNSSTFLSDINYPTVSDIPKPPSQPVMHMEAVTKPPEKNITITNDSPASPPYHEKISHQQTLTNLVNIERFIDCCALVTKNQDKDERMIFRKIISNTSDLDHENLISLTHFLPMDFPVVISDIAHQASFNNPIPSTSHAFAVNDNFKSVEIDLLSGNDEKPTSNLDQNHPVQLPPSLPLTFDLDYPSVTDVVNQWDQSSQKWSNERSSYNEHQRNIEQPQQKLLQQRQQHPATY